MFFLWFVIIFLATGIAVATLSIKIQFENFKINLPKSENNIVDEKSKVQLKIYIFKKIRVANIDLKKFEEQEKRYEQVENIIKKIAQKSNKPIEIKGIVQNVSIEKINVQINVGLGDAANTAILVGVLYTFFENLVRNKIKNAKEQKCEIKPNYNTEMLFVKFDGIFGIDVWNIIFNWKEQFNKKYLFPIGEERK